MRARTPHPAVAEVGQLLGAFLGSYELARREVSPTPDSPWRAEEDMGLPPTRRPGVSGSILTHATLSTHLRMLASMDCMKGIVSSIEAGTSLYSVFPLARTAVEGFAYAAWILDPRITGQQRALRGAQDHKKSTEHLLGNRRAERAVNPASEEQAEALDDSIRGLQETMQHIKADLAVTRRLVPNPQRESYPAISKVVAEAMDAALGIPGVGTTVYGYLCTVVHPGVAGLLVQRPFDEDRRDFNIPVDRYLAPVGMASHVMCLSLTRLSQHWGLPSPASDTAELMNRMQANFYQYRNDLAFS